MSKKTLAELLAPSSGPARAASEFTLVKPRILVIDIETRPNLAYVWGLWDQNIGLSQLVQAGNVISFAAKWYGEPETMFYSDFHHGHEAMVLAAWELMHEADAIVHFNGVTFDMKHLNREFILAGFTPPSPHKDIDLLRTVKSRFRFVSNKLQNVSTELGLAGKVQHSGFDLWVRCMAGDAEAWREMEEYNVQDVVLTEELYDYLRPWIKNHPALGILVNADELTCDQCGSHELSEQGTQTVGRLVYPRLLCGHCGAWRRGSKNIGRAGATYGI